MGTVGFGDGFVQEEGFVLLLFLLQVLAVGLDVGCDGVYWFLG